MVTLAELGQNKSTRSRTECELWKQSRLLSNVIEPCVSDHSSHCWQMAMIGWANICRAEDLHFANRLLARGDVCLLSLTAKKAGNLNICLFCEYFHPQGRIKHSRNKGLMEWWKYVHLRESEFEGPFYLYSSSVSSHPDLIWGWTCSKYALIALLRATCLVSSGFERFPCSDIARRQFPSLGGGIEPDSSWERASHKFSQIKANFSFWCSQLWIMAGKRGKL